MAAQRLKRTASMGISGWRKPRNQQRPQPRLKQNSRRRKTIYPMRITKTDNLHTEICNQRKNRVPALACVLIFAMSACSLFPHEVLAQASNKIPATPAELEELLDRVSKQTEAYKETSIDLTAEERRTFEIFSPDGKVEKHNRLIADLIIYQPQRDAKRAVEFRNIREVDGQSVKKQDVRLEKLFERLKKDDSADKEIGRIVHESTRYDFGHQVAGYMFYKAIATLKKLRPFFKFEAAGPELVGERELLAVKFEQTEFRKNMFGLTHSFDVNLFTGPMMRGVYWIDPDTAQIWREHYELFFRNNQS